MHFLLESVRNLLLFLCSAALPTTHGLATPHSARSVIADLGSIHVIPHLGHAGFMRTDAGEDDDALPDDDDDEPGTPAAPAPVVSVEVLAGGASFDLGIVLVNRNGMGALERTQGVEIAIGPCRFIVETGTASDGVTAHFGVYGLLAGPRLAGGIGLVAARGPT